MLRRMPLPPQIDPAAFDALHDDVAQWPDAVASIAAEHGSAIAEPLTDGTVLVARLSGGRILKLFPPFLADHHAFERAMLGALHGRLAVPTPRLLAEGERDGWPYLLMSELHGTLLADGWPALAEAERLALLRSIGALATAVHALPVGPIAALAPRWSDFIATQRERCIARQRRTGLPQHLLAQLPDFVAGELPSGDAVLLTGEYTPWNLMLDGPRLAAMFDFGDGLVGPRAYDWLGPLCFLAAGDGERCAALLDGCGVTLTAPLRLQLMRLLLLHRYSNLKMQLRCPGWQAAPDFEALAELAWPLR